MELHNLTIQKARKALDAGEYTAVELTQAYLDAIAKKNPELNAYLEVFTEDALKDAKHADDMIAKGAQQALTGIPIAIKDNLMYKGHVCSAASKMLEKYVAVYDATVIKKLKKQGIVILGRANMDEFAMGSSTENSAFGRTMNPHDPERIPGGSSGGSAAAVSAHLALAALGTDTGGSIRQPASLCGVVGLKTTYGAVSRYGAVAMGSSLDQIGPLTNSVADAELMFEGIRGEDPNDSTTTPEGLYPQQKRKKVIGVPRDFMKEGVEPDVLAKFEQSLEQLAAAGYEIRDITLPTMQYALAAYYIIMPAEVSTNLARLDGLRYGLHEDGVDYKEIFSKSRGKGFGKETRRRIMLGTYVLSAGYADAYYRKAVAVRSLIRKECEDAFKEVDVIATPTSPEPAFKAGAKSDPLAMYAADIFTVPVNIAGVPAISVPMGTAEREGKQLPLGLQIVGPHGGEDALFAVAKDVEKLQR